MPLPETVCLNPFGPFIVDLWGLEPQTFGMQIRRSSQLSYRPSATRSLILNAKKQPFFQLPPGSYVLHMRLVINVGKYGC